MIFTFFVVPGPATADDVDVFVADDEVCVVYEIEEMTTMTISSMRTTMTTMRK
jgi:hypothetical protein